MHDIAAAVALQPNDNAFTNQIMPRQLKAVDQEDVDRVGSLCYANYVLKLRKQKCRTSQCLIYQRL